MMRKNSKGFASIVAAVVIVAAAVVALVPDIKNSLMSVISDTPELCTIAPYDWECICINGLQKVGRLKYRCEPMPSIPGSYNLPIETWEEAIRFSYDQIGIDVGCENDLAFANPIIGQIKEYGYGVYPGTTKVKCHYIMTIECLQQTGPFSGKVAWNVYFDPQTGHIFERNCNPDLIEYCPGNIPFMPLDECYLPAEVCGDGECYGTETIDNCPSDCGQPSCGDGICGNTKVQINGCLLPDGNRVECAITGYRPSNGELCSAGLPECHEADVLTFASYTTENANICPQDCA